MIDHLKNPEVARVLSNNLRMIIGFLVGLYVVKGFLGFGEVAYQIYVLVVLGAGVGIMVRELLRLSLLSYISSSYAQGKNFHSVFSFSKKILITNTAIGMAVIIIEASIGEVKLSPLKNNN